MKTITTLVARLKTICKISLWICLLNASSCQENEYADINFNSHLDRKIFLSQCGEKAMKSTGKKKEKYLKLYFRAFPKDFETFFKTVDSDCHGDTIYIVGNHISGGYFKNPWGKFYPTTKLVKTAAEIPKERISKQSQQYLDNMPVPYMNDRGTYIEDLTTVEPDRLYHWKLILINIHYLDVREELLKVIPDKLYYEKIISMCIGGFDPYSLQMEGIVLPDDDLVLQILEQKTDEEIAGFFFCYYDGPLHPGRTNIRDSLYEKAEKSNPRIFELMNKAYEAILAYWGDDWVGR